MGEGFTTYTVRVEGLPIKLDYIVMYFIVICDGEASINAVNFATVREGLNAAITFFSRLGR